MDDDHACRITRDSSGGNLIFRIVCRCGYTGPPRTIEQAVLADRLAHKRNVDIPAYPPHP